MKNGKATGHDGITNEQIKYGGKTLIEKLTNLFNEILLTGKTPEQWKKSDIILLFKKGDRHQISNYRPITLSPSLSKIYFKLIENGTRPILIEQQPQEQAGFRKNYSTIDHLHTINQLI